MKFLQSDHSRNYASLILRLAAAMLLMHGWPKLMHFSERADKFADPIGIGPTGSLALTVFAEVLCTAFVVVGLFTRVASIPVVITMVVAVLFAHEGDPLADREPALMYLALFSAIFFLGGGRFSADNYLRKNHRF